MLEKKNKDIILEFKGNLDYDNIGELISKLRENMQARQVRFGLFKKLLTLMIESLENIVRYNSGMSLPPSIIDIYPPEMIISSIPDYFLLETANLINNTDITALDEKLSTLNNFGLEEIKQLYKATITNGKFSEKGGAGLGIIEMAKIIEGKIDYSFQHIDTDYSYFILKLAIRSDVLGK